MTYAIYCLSVYAKPFLISCRRALQRLNNHTRGQGNDEDVVRLLEWLWLRDI
jgi:hypothetical protein